MDIVTFLNNKISSFFADNTSQLITEAKLREVCNDMVDNFGTAVEITVADLTILIGAQNMRPGWYKITDSTCADKGVFARAVDNKTIAIAAVGVYANCDFQNLRGWNVGVWNSGLSGLMANTSICIWQGFHYKNLTGVVGTQPDGDTVNWVYLPKSDASYVNEYDVIEYQFGMYGSETLNKRKDKRGNSIQYSNAFQWGNDNVQGCSDEWGATFFMLNNRGVVWGVAAIGGSVVSITDNHQGYLLCSKLAGNGNISIELPVGEYIYDWNVQVDEDITIGFSNNTMSKTVTNTISDVNKVIDITGSNTIGLTTNDKYLGFVKLGSSNATEDISAIGYLKEGRILRCQPKNGLTVTFWVGGSISLKGGVNVVINGTNGDWIDFQMINGMICEINRGQY